jgi:hypothetical protein
MRTTLLVILLGLTVTPSAAQTLQFFGGRVGVNHSGMVADELYDYRPGAQVGVFAELGFGQTLGALAELEYAIRGYGFLVQEVDDEGFVVDQTRATTTLHYLSIPVLMRLHMDTGVELSPYVVLGPRFDFLIARRQGRGTVGDVDEQDYVVGRLGTTGVSASGGLGLAFRNVLTREVRLEGRFNISFTNRLRGGRGDEFAYPQSLDVSLIFAL